MFIILSIKGEAINAFPFLLQYLSEKHDLSMKYFKNRRVNLKFKDAKSATNFFQYFD
jgi:hypothetical protein